MNIPPQPVQRKSLTEARLRKHADYQRAYAASRKRQSTSMSWFLAPHNPLTPAQRRRRARAWPHRRQGARQGA